MRSSRALASPRRMPERVLGESQRLDAPRLVAARAGGLGERVLGPARENVDLCQEAGGLKESGAISRTRSKDLPGQLQVADGHRVKAHPHERYRDRGSACTRGLGLGLRLAEPARMSEHLGARDVGVGRCPKGESPGRCRPGLRPTRARDPAERCANRKYASPSSGSAATARLAASSARRFRSRSVARSGVVLGVIVQRQGQTCPGRCQARIDLQGCLELVDERGRSRRRSPD